MLRLRIVLSGSQPGPQHALRLRIVLNEFRPSQLSILGRDTLPRPLTKSRRGGRKKSSRSSPRTRYSNQARVSWRSRVILLSGGGKALSISPQEVLAPASQKGKDHPPNLPASTRHQNSLFATALSHAPSIGE